MMPLFTFCQIKNFHHYSFKLMMIMKSVRIATDATQFKSVGMLGWVVDPLAELTTKKLSSASTALWTRKQLSVCRHSGVGRVWTSYFASVMRAYLILTVSGCKRDRVKVAYLIGWITATVVLGCCGSNSGANSCCQSSMPSGTVAATAAAKRDDVDWQEHQTSALWQWVEIVGWWSSTFVASWLDG